MSLLRTPEPQPEDPYLEAVEYQSMDHDQVNRQFVVDLLTGPTGPRVIDLGCGPAGIPIELCSQHESVEVLAIDEEPEMLDLAKRDIDAAGYLDRIILCQGDANDLDWLEDATADTVISNSLIHHLDSPEKGFNTAARLVKSAGRLFIRDLARPETEADIEDLVGTYCSGESTRAKQLFRQSLHAALNLNEVREICGGLGITPNHVQMSSDRHWTVDWKKTLD